MTIDLHPLCSLFPRLGQTEFGALVADIKANGLREMIVLHDGMILDGGNRYRACIEAGVEPRFCTFAGGNAVSYVLSANLHRRHLTPGQQAAIVASAQDWATAHTHGGDRKSDQSAILHFDSAATRASESGVSLRTQKMADKVAKADPELAKRVGHGEVSLPEAVKRVSGKRPGAKPKKPAKKPAAAPIPVELDDDIMGTSQELLEELQAEVEHLSALLKAAEADDLKAEAIKWRRAYEDAGRKQADAMDATKRAERREAFTKKQLMRCGRAVGESDPDKVAPAVEAFVREHKLKAAQ